MNDVEFQLNHLKLRGIALGDKNAPVMLCLHGWLDNAASFSALMPYLSHYHVIAIDLPGHGLSEHRSDDAYYHFVDWLDDLVQLFMATGWQKIHLVGHSMGAMIASAFTAAFPEKVKKLTLIDAFGFLTVPAKDNTKQLRNGLLNRQTLRAKVNKNVKVYSTIEAATNARLAVADFAYEHAKVLVNRNIKSKHNGYVWRYDQKLRLVSPYRFTEAQAEQLLIDVSVPYQLILGNSGALMVKETMVRYKDLLKNTPCFTVKGGHHVHMQSPERVAELIVGFHHE